MTGYRNAGPSLTRAIWPAVFAAGPLFLGAASLAALYLELPNAIDLSANAVLLFVIALVPAAIIGALLGVVPILIGTSMLHALGNRISAFRSPVCWAALGAGAGGLVAHLVENGSPGREIAFALITTGMLCALIAQQRMYRRPTLAS